MLVIRTSEGSEKIKGIRKRKETVNYKVNVCCCEFVAERRRKCYC